MLAVFAMVQVGDILKCIVGFVLVKKGVWMQNIVSGNRRGMPDNYFQIEFLLTE